MTISNDDRAKISQWIKDECLNVDYAKRMVMPLEQQRAEGKLFPVEDKEIPFANGVELWKYVVCKSLMSNDTMQKDLLDLKEKKLAASAYEHYEHWLAKENVKALPSAKLYAALISAQCGFIGLTAQEFKALQSAPATGKFANNISVAKEIFQSRPGALAQCEYSEFMEIAKDVLANHGIVEESKAAENAAAPAPAPVAVEAAPTPAPQISEARNDGTVITLLQRELTRSLATNSGLIELKNQANDLARAASRQVDASTQAVALLRRDLERAQQQAQQTRA